MFDKMMLKEGVNEIVCLLMEDETCTFGMARTTANPTFMHLGGFALTLSPFLVMDLLDSLDFRFDK